MLRLKGCDLGVNLLRSVSFMLVPREALPTVCRRRPACASLSMRYSFVLLDVGETLVGPSESFGAVYARVLAEMGQDLPADRLERCLREVWGEQDRIVPPGSDRYAHYPGGESEYWFRFARNTLESAFGESLENAFVLEVLERLRVAFRDRAAWRVYPDVVPALKGLREDGVRLLECTASTALIGVDALLDGQQFRAVGAWVQDDGPLRHWVAPFDAKLRDQTEVWVRYERRLLGRRRNRGDGFYA